MLHTDQSFTLKMENVWQIFVTHTFGKHFKTVWKSILKHLTQLSLLKGIEALLWSSSMKRDTTCNKQVPNLRCLHTSSRCSSVNTGQLSGVSKHLNGIYDLGCLSSQQVGYNTTAFTPTRPGISSRLMIACSACTHSLQLNVLTHLAPLHCDMISSSDHILLLTRLAFLSFIWIKH